MKKALVVKSEFEGRSVGHVERVEDAAQIDPLSGNHYERMEKVEVPVELENIPQGQLKGVLVPIAAEKWTKEGEADVSIDPKDGTWTYVPASPEHWEIQKADSFVAYDKKVRTDDKLKTLEQDVITEMGQVYGTKNPDSAVANYLTWLAMKNTPAKFVGLVARFDVVGLSIGDALDTKQKVSDYATALVDLADDYAVYREQKILTYAAEKAAIDAE